MLFIYCNICLGVIRAYRQCAFPACATRPGGKKGLSGSPRSPQTYLHVMTHDALTLHPWQPTAKLRVAMPMAAPVAAAVPAMAMAASLCQQAEEFCCLGLGFRVSGLYWTADRGNQESPLAKGLSGKLGLARGFGVVLAFGGAYSGAPFFNTFRPLTTSWFLAGHEGMGRTPKAFIPYHRT